MLSNLVFKIKLNVPVGINGSGWFDITPIMKRAVSLQIYLFFFKFNCFTVQELEITLSDVTINPSNKEVIQNE